MLTGGCFCGRVRYEAGGAPYNATVCHCVRHQSSIVWIIY